MLTSFQNDFIEFLKSKDELSFSIIKTVKASLVEFNELSQDSNDATAVRERLRRTLEEYLSCKKMQGCSSGTLANYRHHLTSFISSLDKPIEYVSPQDIQKFLMLYQNRNVSLRSVEHRRLVLCSFFQWLVDTDALEKNPAKKIHKIKFEAKERQPLTYVELEKMRSACKNLRERAILEFLFSTGCRVSELTNVRLSDLDIREGSVNIRGKGSKYNTCFLTPQAIYHLEMYLSNRSSAAGNIFLSNRKSKYTKEGVELMIRNLAKRAGVAKKVTPHTIRHTTATFALRRGMPVEEVSKMLGHSSIDTTMIYAQVDRTKLQHDHGIYLT